MADAEVGRQDFEEGPTEPTLGMCDFTGSQDAQQAAMNWAVERTVFGELIAVLLPT